MSMSYLPIQIAPDVDGSIRRLVEGRVDLYLRDVHAMLRLPLPGAGIDAGCNFTIAGTLCAVAAGLSRVFVPGIRWAGEAFRNVLVEYPYADEPAGAIIGVDFANHLYDTYRNNLAHSLGINIDWNGSEQVIKTLGTVKIARHWLSASEQQLNELESDSRPAWLGKTLELDGRTYKLGVEPLYWGVRKLTQRLATTEPYASNARKMLATAGSGYGLSLTGTLGPRYRAGNEISATAMAVTSTSPPDFTTSTERENKLSE
jgi:hypothetical protein